MKTVLISCATHHACHYVNALAKVDIKPVLSSEIEDENCYDGLLLPGGGDIAPVLYHRKNRGSREICITEDIIQLLLCHRFMEQKKPILGICKGMQLINVALGGSLIQDLPTRSLHAYEDKDHYHSTKTLPQSQLHSLYGSSCFTNSAHHQAINKLGKNLIATQYADDGVVEAIEHTTLPILGVQWHPERIYGFQRPLGCADGQLLFSHFYSLL